jgi:hypothetical protein
MKSYLLLILVCTLFLTGCSPFGNSSLIESIGSTISDIFSTKTTAEMNAGGSQSLISSPASASAGDVHQMTISVGNVYQQNSFVTATGHTVEVVISGTRQ